jgi:voltage-dependent calcium channel beta-2
MFLFLNLQGSADSNYSQPSSDLSLDEEKETLRREKERQALNQLDKARVSGASVCAARPL